MEMITRTFVKTTTIYYRPVVGGQVGQDNTLMIEGRVADPIKTVMKALNMGRNDSVILSKVVEDKEVLGMPIDKFKENATLIEK